MVPRQESQKLLRKIGGTVLATKRSRKNFYPGGANSNLIKQISPIFYSIFSLLLIIFDIKTN